MKKFLSLSLALCVMVSLSLLSACVNSVEDGGKDDQPLCKLSVSVGQLVSTHPITGESNIGTRAALTLSDQAKALTLFAVAEDGSVAASVTQASTEPGYGSITMELPHGSYTLVVVAHNGAQASYADGIIAFEDGKVTDTFIGTKAVTLSYNASPISTTITLQRRVAKLTIDMQDALPSSVNEAKVSISTYSPKFDLSANAGTASEPLERSFNLTSYRGQTDISISIYTFLPTATTSTSLTYTVTDTSDATLYTHTFPSLNLAECTQTKVYGHFFTSSDVWTIELMGDWKTSIDYNIND